ncbi:hypothetical protein [Geminisphaera colitermitum]|uniref:hypothetical protein n=1 Tax=Geminisphaera colitermitum TaxID=1148786 RepID=UPI0001964F80|nr:hypothetical protein [Geminisphaera colitermitum]
MRPLTRRELIARHNINKAALAAHQAYGFDHPITKAIRAKSAAIAAAAETSRMPDVSILKGGAS